MYKKFIKNMKLKNYIDKRVIGFSRASGSSLKKRYSLKITSCNWTNAADNLLESCFKSLKFKAFAD